MLVKEKEIIGLMSSPAEVGRRSRISRAPRTRLLVSESSWTLTFRHPRSKLSASVQRHPLQTSLERLLRLLVDACTKALSARSCQLHLLGSQPTFPLDCLRPRAVRQLPSPVTTPHMRRRASDEALRRLCAERTSLFRDRLRSPHFSTNRCAHPGPPIRTIRFQLAYARSGRSSQPSSLLTNLSRCRPVPRFGGILPLRLSGASMTSRLRNRLVERPRPDLPQVCATAPRHVHRPRHSIRGAPTLPLTLIRSDSIDQQASAARCRGCSRRAEPCPTIMDGGCTRAAARRQPQGACARRELLPQPHNSRLLAMSWRARGRSSRAPLAPQVVSFHSTVPTAIFPVFSASRLVRGRRTHPHPTLLALALLAAHVPFHARGRVLRLARR